MRTLLFTEWGPCIRYDGNDLHVEDISPHWEAKWRLSRWELFTFGARLIVAALSRKG